MSKIILHLHKKRMRTGIVFIFILLILYSCNTGEKQEVTAPVNKYVSSGIIDTTPANNIIDSLQKKILSGGLGEDSTLLELAMNYIMLDPVRLKKITKIIIDRNSKNQAFSDKANILNAFVYVSDNDSDSCALYLGKIDTLAAISKAFIKNIRGYLLRNSDSLQAEIMIQQSCVATDNITEFNRKYRIDNKDFPETVSFMCHYLRFKFFGENPDTIRVNESLRGLERLADKTINPVVKINSYNQLGFRAYRDGRSEKAIEYFNHSVEELVRINEPAQLSNTYNNLGVLYYHLGDNDRALEYYNKALDCSHRIDDNRGIAKILNNIAVIYDLMGKTREAITSYMESLKIRESLNDSSGMSLTYNNLGIIFENLGDTLKALEYYSKSLVIDTKLDDQESLSYTYDNLSGIFNKMGLMDSALYYVRKCVRIREQSGDVLQLPPSYNNLGSLFLDLKIPDSALFYYNLALKYATENNDPNDIISASTSLGRYYFGVKDYLKAKTYAVKAYEMAEKIEYPELVRNAALLLSEIYSENGDVKNEITYFKKYVNISDSLSSLQNKQILQQRYYQYEYDKKALADSIVFEQKMLVKNSELKRIEDRNQSQLLLIYLIIGVVIIVAVFLFIIIRQAFVRKKINEMLVLKNTSISNKNELLISQKYELQFKNKQIGDSIDYARNLQMALLPSEEFLKSLFPGYFLYFLPKDIIGGDFYWTASDGNYKYVAVADCTGHGVPGAIISTMSIILLNKIVNEKPAPGPRDILMKLNTEFLECLSQSDNLIVNDGLDITLIRISETDNQLVVSSANQTFYLSIPGKELQEFGGGIISVGSFKSGSTNDILSEQIITYEPGSVLYLLTDGYADQFGGEENKKFTYKEIFKLIGQIRSHPFTVQIDAIRDEHISWKGKQKQTDDITVLAIKL